MARGGTLSVMATLSPSEMYCHVVGWSAAARARAHPQAAATTATHAMPAATKKRRCHARPPGPADGDAASMAVDWYLVSASAAANSAAVAKRSAGSFSRAVKTAASTWGGMVWRWLVSERGVSVTTRAMIAWAVGPMNGGSPVSIS